MNIYETLELAEVVTGLKEGTDIGKVEEVLEKELGISSDTFKVVAEALLKLTPIVRTAVTNTAVHGFIKDNCFIVKEDAIL